MCTHFSVFIHNIYLQNTDFEVIHKRNKYYPTPAPPPLALAISCLQRCGHFRSHFGQNVISSLSMSMVSNRPYSVLVIVFTPEVIGRRGFWRGARKDHNIILVRSYNKTMDGLVIKKKLYFLKEKKNCTFIRTEKKKLYSGVKTRTPPPLVMKWEAP